MLTRIASGLRHARITEQATDGLDVSGPELRALGRPTPCEDCNAGRGPRGREPRMDPEDSEGPEGLRAGIAGAVLPLRRVPAATLTEEPSGNIRSPRGASAALGEHP